MTRRSFLKYAAAACGLTATPSLVSITDKAAADTVQKHNTKTYKFEGNIKVLGIGAIDIGASLEIRYGESGYSSSLKAFKLSDENEIYCIYASQGFVSNGALLPRKSEIYRKYPSWTRIFWFYKHDRIDFEFGYADGKLLSIKRTEENLSKRKKEAKYLPAAGELYKSSVDILTAIIRILSQLKNGETPNKVNVIDNKGRPKTANITVNGRNVSIDAEGKDFHFKSASIQFDYNFEPLEIKITKIHGWADLEGRSINP